MTASGSNHAQMEISVPQLEPRLKKRYKKLVLEHLNTNSELAAGLRALPGEGKAFASTQGAYRYYDNPEVTLSKLAQPLKQEGLEFITSECQDYALIVHDWSDLRYDKQSLRKNDQIELGRHRGYEMQSSLLVSDRSGMPLAMLSLNLTASDGIHSTEADQVLERQAPLDQLSETITYLRKEEFPLPLVHIIDREGDSIFHMRLWDARGDFFVTRANDYRYARWEQERRSRLSELGRELEFKPDKVVDLTAQVQAQAFVASQRVIFTDPAHRRLSNNKRKVIPGEPLALRWIVVQLRSPDEALLAEWYLLTNLPESVSASRIAEWYYWRWTIESMHKLIKSAGLHIEQWQQRSAAATAKRLLVAAMACIVVWQVQRADSPKMESFRQLLLRLSGRQIRPGQAPAPALFSGLWRLLGVLDALQNYDIKELLELASVLPLGPLLDQIKLKQGFNP